MQDSLKTLIIIFGEEAEEESRNRGNIWSLHWQYTRDWKNCSWRSWAVKIQRFDEDIVFLKEN